MKRHAITSLVLLLALNAGICYGMKKDETSWAFWRSKKESNRVGQQVEKILAGFMVPIIGTRCAMAE